MENEKKSIGQHQGRGGHVRISGGLARGVPLHAPKGNDVRPAMDRLRQAIFSALAERIPEAHFIDAFAGSGSYGLEAISRGAASGVFIERDHRALECLRVNIAAVAKSMRAETLPLEIASCDVLDWKNEPQKRADLIFVDPPYPIINTIAPQLFARFQAWLAEHERARVVFEMPTEIELTPPGWECTRRFGGGGPSSASICVYKRSAISE